MQVKISGDRLRVFFSPRADDIFLRVTDVRVPSDAPAPIAHLYNQKKKCGGEYSGVNIFHMRMQKPRAKQKTEKEGKKKTTTDF